MATPFIPRGTVGILTAGGLALIRSVVARVQQVKIRLGHSPKKAKGRAPDDEGVISEIPGSYVLVQEGVAAVSHNRR